MPRTGFNNPLKPQVEDIMEVPISFATSPPQPSSEPHQCPINPPPRHKS
jgi:hypothetical protein